MVPSKLDHCNSQRKLEKPDLDEEEAHDLEFDGNKKISGSGTQISKADERGEIQEVIRPNKTLQKINSRNGGSTICVDDTSMRPIEKGLQALEHNTEENISLVMG